MERKKKVKILLIYFLINLCLILPVSNISILCNNRKENYEQDFNQQNLFLQSSSKDEFFSYYKEITIDHNKVSGSSNLINFPVLISIIDSDLHDYVQSNGNDIAFAIDDIWLDHEIELFNQTYSDTHAKLVAWLRIPSLSPSTDTIITMYYGNSTMTSQENPSGVWNSDYSGVWHLHNDFQDSTNNSNDGTNHGSSDTVGKIGDAQDFAGYDTDQEITIAPSESLNPTYITVSAWIYPRGQVGETGMFVSDYDWTNNSMKVYNLYMHPTNRIHLLLYYSNGNGSYIQVWSDVLPMYEWYFVHFTVNSTMVALFVDGAIPTGAETVATASYTGGLRQFTNIVEIGSEEQMSSCDHEFNGTIDEVRISSSAHSAAWIATEYNNQFNPNNFYSVGSSQEINPIPPSWSNLIETDPLELGNAEIISIDVLDLSGVAQVKFEIETTNYTMVNIAGNTWQNDAWIPSSTGNYNYTIYMQDNNNNWNTTSDSIQVIDTTPPTYSQLTESEDPLELGHTETITIKIIDLSGINQVLFEINGKANYTMNYVGGNLWRNNSWTPTSKGTHNYKIFIQDNNNNWNSTSGSILVIESHLPNGGFDFTTLLIIIGITGGIIGAVIGIIILIKKRPRKPKDKELDTIESIID